jgi:hypothetical protein
MPGFGERCDGSGTPEQEIWTGSQAIFPGREYGRNEPVQPWRRAIDTLLAAMAILIDSPWLAAMAGLLLIGLGRWRHRRLAVIAGGVWLLYGGYETGMKLRWLCSGECNIRIDLLVIYPLLFVLLLVALIALALGRKTAPEGR